MTKAANITDINLDNDELTCPITLELFHDPVRAQDGHVYERQAITQWIQEHGTSPLTRQPLQIDQLQSDEHLKCLAKQRRNSIVSYNVENNLVTLPIRRIMKTHSNRITTTNRLKTCLCNSIYCKLCLVLLVSGLVLGLIFGIMRSNSYSSDATNTVNYDFSSITRYSSKLTYNSSLFNRPTKIPKRYYYEAIRMMIPSKNYYRFRSISNIDMYGYLYTSNFNDSNSNDNLLQSDDDSDGFQQFRILILLSIGNYTLVATTYSQNVTGNFSILIEGPTNVILY